MDYYDLAENLNFGYTILLNYLVFLILFGLFCLLLSRLTIKINRDYEKQNLFTKFVILCNHLIRSDLSIFKILFLFLGLFFWFTLIFLTNNIKTNKVVVDTSVLMKSASDLFKADSPACFYMKDTEMNLAINSPKNTILSRLFYEKTYFRKDQVEVMAALNSKRCLMPFDPNSAELLKNDGSVIISQTECRFLKFSAAFVNKIFILYIF